MVSGVNVMYLLLFTLHSSRIYLKMNKCFVQLSGVPAESAQ